jgi:hypothetical protein
VIEVHYYGGNRGPLYHGADKVEVTEEEVARRKPESWFYSRIARRWLAARLPWLWDDAWNVVSRRAGADRGHDDGRRAGRAGGR